MNAEVTPLRIGEVAAEAGVSKRTVDYYTRIGLIQTLGRTQGNYRLYSPEVPSEIRLIRSLEDQGVSLEQISSALKKGDGREVVKELRKLERELRDLQKAVPAVAGTEATGALSAIIDKMHALLATALEITGGQIPPIS